LTLHLASLAPNQHTRSAIHEEQESCNHQKHNEDVNNAFVILPHYDWMTAFNMTITSQEFNLEKQSIQSYSAAGILNTGPDAITKKIFLTVNTKNEPNVDAA
jgi:hypothetical protein